MPDRDSTAEGSVDVFTRVSMSRAMRSGVDGVERQGGDANYRGRTMTRGTQFSRTARSTTNCNPMPDRDAGHTRITTPRFQKNNLPTVSSHGPQPHSGPSLAPIWHQTEKTSSERRRAIEFIGPPRAVTEFA